MKTNLDPSVLTASSLLGELFLFEGHAVRVVGTPENPLFVAQDVCDVLDIANSRDALSRLSEDEVSNVGSTDIRNAPNRGLQAVTESGLYALIFKSRKAEAVRFRRWVTGEVLPALRKHGFYAREGLDARLARIERAKALRARKSALLAEARALAAEVSRLEELGEDACTVAEALGQASAPLPAINAVLAYARRNHVPVGRRAGRTILPRAAIVAALGLDQVGLDLN